MAHNRTVTQFERTENLKDQDEECHIVGVTRLKLFRALCVLLTATVLKVTEHETNVAGRGWGIRHVECAVMAVATFMAYSLRTNLSVAIVAMVRYNGTNETSPDLAPTYDWTEETQGYLLSSFFWGYFILQIPAGIITEKFGGHRFLCVAILGSSSLTLLLPQCAYIGGWFLVCINRMLQGICQGFVFPSVFTLLGVWSPPLERSRLSGISVGAQLLGPVVCTPISGLLCSNYGWPSVFYTFGAAGVVFGIVMLLLGADSPAKHRMISVEEKQYIQDSLGGAKLKLSVPWKNVFTSAPYWSALLTMAMQSLVYLMLLTKIPTYLATVLMFSIEDNGFITALPYLVSWLFSFIFSWTCDFITERELVSLTVARKSFNCIAHFGSAIFIALMGHSEDRTVSVFLLTAFMGAQGGVFTGVQANFVDLAPNFSGTIFSVANFACACFGLVGPIIVAFIVTEAGSAAQWRIVFYLCATVLTLSQIVYFIWGSAETQWWNWPNGYEDKEDLKEREKIHGTQEKSI